MLDAMQLVAANFLDFTGAQWALMGSGVVIILTVRRWRQLTVRKKNALDYQPMTAKQETAPDRRVPNALNVREIASELQSLLAELEETSRRLTAQLDNRYTRLELLISEADAKIRQLENLAAPAKEHSSTTGPASTPSDAERTLQRLRQERGAPSPTDDPAYQPIYELSDRGQSPREIAQQLARQPGEIELILALRSRQHAS